MSIYLSCLVQYMAESKHKNLRTFQFYLSKIEVLYEAISQIDNQAKEKFFRYILRYCFKICVCYKAGTYIDKWEKRQEYGNLDLCRVKRMLRMYEEQYINSKNDTTFYKLEDAWYLLDDEEIEKYLDIILKELSEGKYEASEYERMIFCF